MATSEHDDRAAKATATLRPATEADYGFMCSLYASTREAEMTHFPFDEAQKQAFLDQQFAGKPVTIHVEGFNPALSLYQRLGFEHVDTNGVYFLLRWTPPQVNTAS